MVIFSLYDSENLLTCQRASKQSKRQGDDQRVVDNSFTCQEALCNQRKRQADGQRAIATDPVHRSTTAVENCDPLSETYRGLSMNQSEFYKNLLKTYRELSNVNETTELHLDNHNEYDTNKQTINHN